MRTRLLAAGLLLLPLLSTAQATPFVEGTLTYSVSLRPANGQESLGTQAGTYKLILKGSQVRRELQMNSGYHSIVLYDGRNNTGAILQETPDQKFAVRLESADMDKRRAPWVGFRLDESRGTETVNGADCRKGTVRYTDGSEIDICLGTMPVAPDTWVFSRLPGIRAVPLRFQLRNKSGSLVYFQLEKAEAEPIEAALFRVPAGYKILSAAELHDNGE